MSQISSVVHLFLSTVPFLILSIYFIYLALIRPEVIAEHYKVDYYENDVEDDDPDILISLDSMLDTFLFTLVLWTSLAVYVIFFVSRRRRLMKSFVKKKPINSSDNNETEVPFQVVGDVFYDHPKNWIAKLLNKMHQTDIAYVTYPFHDANRGHNDSTSPANKLQENYRQKQIFGFKNKKKNSYSNNNVVDDDEYDPKLVQKKIRTYHPYHREKVAIVILPGHPFSGQPLADVDRDLSSYESEYAVRSRDKINQVAFLCIFWVIFCFGGALTMIKQMEAVNEEVPAGEDDLEDVDAAWLSFWIIIGIVLPLFAIGGNIIQWFMYRHWILNSGKIVFKSNATKVPPKFVQPEELYADEDGGFALL